MIMVRLQMQETQGNERNQRKPERKRGRMRGGSRGRSGREPAKGKWRQEAQRRWRIQVRQNSQDEITDTHLL